MDISKLPIPVTKLFTWMPHRPPAVWVDEVLSFGKEGGECRLQLREDGTYMGPRGLRSSAPIEFIAQAFGYVTTCLRLANGATEETKVGRVYLVQIKNAELPETPDVKPGDEIRIQIGKFRQMGHLGMFQGKVTGPRGLIAQADLKTFSEVGI